MSIEALIQAHTEALHANTEAVKLLTSSLAGRSATAANKAADAVDTKTVKKQEKTPSPKAEESPIDLAKGESADTGSEQPSVPYETVRAFVLKLASGGKRAEIQEVFSKHAIASIKVLLDKQDDFSTVNDQAKLEAVYADLQALEA